MQHNRSSWHDPSLSLPALVSCKTALYQQLTVGPMGLLGVAALICAAAQGSVTYVVEQQHQQSPNAADTATLLLLLLVLLGCCCCCYCCCRYCCCGCCGRESGEVKHCCRLTCRGRAVMRARLGMHIHQFEEYFTAIHRLFCSCKPLLCC
jgi:hypothetical protein